MVDCLYIEVISTVNLCNIKLYVRITPYEKQERVPAETCYTRLTIVRMNATTAPPLQNSCCFSICLLYATLCYSLYRQPKNINLHLPIPTGTTDVKMVLQGCKAL